MLEIAIGIYYNHHERKAIAKYWKVVKVDSSFVPTFNAVPFDCTINTHLRVSLL